MGFPTGSSGFPLTGTTYWFRSAPQTWDDGTLVTDVVYVKKEA